MMTRGAASWPDRSSHRRFAAWPGRSASSRMMAAGLPAVRHDAGADIWTAAMTSSSCSASSRSARASAKVCSRSMTRTLMPMRASLAQLAWAAESLPVWSAPTPNGGSAATSNPGAHRADDSLGLGRIADHDDPRRLAAAGDLRAQRERGISWQVSVEQDDVSGLCELRHGYERRPDGSSRGIPVWRSSSTPDGLDPGTGRDPSS